MIQIKNAKLLIISTLTLWCTPTYAQGRLAFQTKCVSQVSEGYITVQLVVKKLNPKKVWKIVQQNALKTFLFSGFAANEQCQPQPPLLNTPEAFAAFEKISSTFFKRKGPWLNYIRTGDVNSGITADNGKLVTYQVSIAKNELRKYLETRNILKPMNHGF